MRRNPLLVASDAGVGGASVGGVSVGGVTSVCDAGVVGGGATGVSVGGVAAWQAAAGFGQVLAYFMQQLRGRGDAAAAAAA